MYWYFDGLKIAFEMKAWTVCVKSSAPFLYTLKRVKLRVCSLTC